MTNAPTDQVHGGIAAIVHQLTAATPVDSLAGHRVEQNAFHGYDIWANPERIVRLYAEYEDGAEGFTIALLSRSGVYFYGLDCHASTPATVLAAAVIEILRSVAW